MKKSRPILSSTDMVRVILDNLKFQTRRLVKPPYSTYPNVAKHLTSCEFDFHFRDGIGQYTKCPYGKPGDQLWVKEHYYAVGYWKENGHTKTGKQKYEFIDLTITDGHQYIYLADKEFEYTEKKFSRVIGWYKRSSLFMPRVASRITLEITDIKVERLNDISEEDAEAEGVNGNFDYPVDFENWALCSTCGGQGVHGALGANLGVMEVDCYDCDTYVKRFKSLWESINGPGSWEKNPWVWVISFRRIEP